MRCLLLKLVLGLILQKAFDDIQGYDEGALRVFHVEPRVDQSVRG
jgi:hypothetical protein